jgi:hypothetical protein
MILLTSCSKKKTALEILQSTISMIDTIESIYYKQDMTRSDPRNINDSIVRFREMYFQRLTNDSIVGVKGHWYMYVNDKENVIYEDIYDGERLVRKNNRDSLARLYDLVKYPGFKKKHFWSHNTPYGLRYEFSYILNNADYYSVERLNDTVFDDKICYQVEVKFENMISLPGFAVELQTSKGSISKTLYVIEKETNFPVRMKAENYSAGQPGQIVFIDQRYYDIVFNLAIDAGVHFATSDESLTGFETIEMRP